MWRQFYMIKLGAVKQKCRRLSAPICRWSVDPKPLQIIELTTITLQII